MLNELCVSNFKTLTIFVDEKSNTHFGNRSWLLRKYPDAIETFGFVTSENRNHLRLEKYHYIDACVIASGGLEFKALDVVYRKRRVPVQDRVLTQGTRSERKLPTGKVMIRLSI